MERINVEQAVSEMRKGLVVKCLFDGKSYKLNQYDKFIVYIDGVWRNTGLDISKIESEWCVIETLIITLSSLKRTREVTHEILYMEDDLLSCIQKINRDISGISLMSHTAKQEIYEIFKKYFGDRLTGDKE